MTTNTIWAREALTSTGWQHDVRVEIDAGGRIARVTAATEPCGHRVRMLLPAPVNLHSHAFQRAMAGLTERRGPDPRDSFWTWRRLMFHFLDRLTPEDVEAIAAFVQMEMLEAGYAAVAEFHYLHHQPGGVPYRDPAEMAGRIVAAAEATGIGLTLLPVLYQVGGCDARSLGPGQIRFGSDPDGFARLVGESEQHLRGLPVDCAGGVAPHSLRAVTPAGLRAAIALAGDRPIHMHLAEQVAEVEEVRAAHGMHPVAWLLETAEVSAQWCLIHCTQMEPQETAALAATGAVAGLCPITEANLGDGIFDGAGWLRAGGRFGIGSDSNIRIALAEELRTLEYSQRLRDRGRAVLAGEAGVSTGRRLFDGACAGGAQAAGRRSGAIAVGLWADLLALDTERVEFTGRSGDLALDTYIFAGDDRMVCDLWSAGRHVVTGGRHRAREAITAGYRATLLRLGDAL
jgi:formimidoylglutamate deiminase